MKVTVTIEGTTHATTCGRCGGAGFHKDGCVSAEPEDDWTDETFVLGAVLAQIEDLDRDAKTRVLNEARRLVEASC